jgi:hypothetical protein
MLCQDAVTLSPHFSSRVKRWPSTAVSLTRSKRRRSADRSSRRPSRLVKTWSSRPVTSPQRLRQPSGTVGRSGSGASWERRLFVARSSYYPRAAANDPLLSRPNGALRARRRVGSHHLGVLDVFLGTSLAPLGVGRRRRRVTMGAVRGRVNCSIRPRQPATTAARFHAGERRPRGTRPGLAATSMSRQ